MRGGDDGVLGCLRDGRAVTIGNKGMWGGAREGQRRLPKES